MERRMRVEKTIYCEDDDYWWLMVSYDGRKMEIKSMALRENDKDKDLIVRGGDLKSIPRLMQFLGSCYREFKKEFPFERK